MVYIEIFILCMVFIALEKKLKPKIKCLRNKLQHNSFLRIFLTCLSVMVIPTMGLYIQNVSNVYIALIFVLIPLGFALDICIVSEKHFTQKAKIPINITKYKLNIILLCIATIFFGIACLFIYVKLNIVIAFSFAVVTVILDIINILLFGKIRKEELNDFTKA